MASSFPQNKEIKRFSERSAHEYLITKKIRHVSIVDRKSFIFQQSTGFKPELKFKNMDLVVKLFRKT